MAETMWHTVLQSQIIHPDWSAQEHLDFLEEEGFDTTKIYDPADKNTPPVEVIDGWLETNPTLPLFQREVERMGHFMKVELRSLEEGDRIISPGNDAEHKVYKVDISGQHVRVVATAWVREGYGLGKEKVLRVVKPSDVHSGLYALPTGTTVRVEPTDGRCPFLGVIMGAVYNGPAGSLVKSYLVLPDGAKTVVACETHWVDIRKVR